MMPFRNMVKRNLEKIKELDFDIIATSHGPIHNDPSLIIDLYNDWVSDEVKNEVVIPYVSMHASTKRMVDYLETELVKKGVTVKLFDLTELDLGELAMALVDAATIVVATPTVLGGAHPLAVYATYLANALRPKTKYLSVIGSYGWGGRTVDQLKEMITNLKVELIEPFIVKGYPKDEDFRSLDALIESIFEKHKNL